MSLITQQLLFLTLYLNILPALTKKNNLQSVSYNACILLVLLQNIEYYTASPRPELLHDTILEIFILCKAWGYVAVHTLLLLSFGLVQTMR